MSSATINPTSDSPTVTMYPERGYVRVKYPAWSQL